MWNIVGNLSAVVTLLGAGAALFLENAWISHLAFVAFLLALAILVARCLAAIKAWQCRHYPKGYLPIATFIRFRTVDGSHYFYETFRHIQIKEAFKNSIEHEFYWTGSKAPDISSSLQEIREIRNGEQGAPTAVKLCFKENRTYNDTEIIHLEMKLDDSDHASQPFLRARIDFPMKFIHFRVELLHYSKPQHFANEAVLGRKPLSANEHADYTVLQNIRFDVATKCYECIVPHPEPGFQYCLQWQRELPPVRRQARKSARKR